MARFKVGDRLIKQKRRYKFILILIVLGIFLGFLYPYLLGDSNKELLNNSIINYFKGLNNDSYNLFAGFKNEFLLNLLISFIIYILGFSIIGIIFVILILIYKGFILGFSFSSIIYVLKFKGILPAVLYIFPNLIISLLVYILLGFYSISFSIKLFKSIFLKNNINFSISLKNYTKVFFLSLFILLCTSLFDAYVTPSIMKLFTNIR